MASVIKNINICNFQGSFEPIFLRLVFHSLLDTIFHHLSAFPVKPVFLSCPTLAQYYLFCLISLCFSIQLSVFHTGFFHSAFCISHRVFLFSFLCFTQGFSIQLPVFHSGFFLSAFCASYSFFLFGFLCFTQVFSILYTFFSALHTIEFTGYPFAYTILYFLAQILLAANPLISM